MELLYIHCVPILSFGAEVKALTGAQMRQLSVALNSAIRRIFTFRRYESIRFLREYHSFKSIEILFAEARDRFLIALANHPNLTVRFLYFVALELID